MKRYKYPRTYHAFDSEKSSDDDKRHENDDHFHGQDVIVTIKMDGENTTIYNDYIHARSLDSRIDSEDRRWVDAFRKSKIEGNIPESYRICGENLFYRHTCVYNDLESMFYAFSIWDGDKCLSWDETQMWCNLLGVKIVPVIYEGVYDKKLIIEEFNKYCKNNTESEGFVVRLSDEFYIDEFETSVSKFVCKTFVLPSEHWRYSAKTTNKLKGGLNPWNAL